MDIAGARGNIAGFQAQFAPLADRAGADVTSAEFQKSFEELAGKIAQNKPDANFVQMLWPDVPTFRQMSGALIDAANGAAKASRDGDTAEAERQADEAVKLLDELANFDPGKATGDVAINAVEYEGRHGDYTYFGGSHPGYPTGD